MSTSAATPAATTIATAAAEPQAEAEAQATTVAASAAVPTRAPAQLTEPRTAAHPAAGPDPADPPVPEGLSGGVGGVPGGRARIDALDAELIELIRRRVAVSAEIQSARISTGGRRLDLRRETEVIGRYTQALGRPGTAVAMALLELGRGRV